MSGWRFPAACGRPWRGVRAGQLVLAWCVAGGGCSTSPHDAASGIVPASVGDDASAPRTTDGGSPSVVVGTDASIGGLAPSDSGVVAHPSLDPPDAGDAGDLSLQRACDARLTAGWQATPPTVGLASASAATSYDAVIGAIMRDYGVPGGAVAVVSNGQLRFAKGYGWADLDAMTAAHPDSLFRVASLSKQITSAAILVLVQRGLLRMTDTPFTMFPLAPLGSQVQNPNLASVTVANLLQHTGGWNRDVQGDPMFASSTIAEAAGGASPPGCTTIARYMLSQSVVYAPGTTYDYSNFGYCVLGLVIENVTDTDYASWVAANVLVPSGANAIVPGATLKSQAVDGEVTYYDYPGAPLAPSVFPSGPATVPWPYGGFFLEAMAAHGAWLASPVEMLRFQVALDGRNSALPALLSAGSLASLVANPRVPSGTPSGGSSPTSSSSWYGLGWQVNSAGNWWHDGSLPGTATEQVHASDGFGWAAVFNTRPAAADAFAARLDADLWAARNGVSSWPAFDLFPQYGPLGPWMSDADLTALSDSQLAGGRYPLKVEGRLAAGGASYRAAFAPVSGVGWRAARGQSCVDFEAANKLLAGEGYAFASLQFFMGADGARRYQATWVKL